MSDHCAMSVEAWSWYASVCCSSRGC